MSTWIVTYFVLSSVQEICVISNLIVDKRLTTFKILFIYLYEACVILVMLMIVFVIMSDDCEFDFEGGVCDVEWHLNVNEWYLWC